MVHVCHQHAAYSVAVIARNSDSVSFVIVRNLVTERGAGEHTCETRTSVLTVVKLSTLMNA